MTLRQKMAWKVLAMLGGLLVVFAVALWGVMGMTSGVRTASDEYSELRLMREADRHWSCALGLLEAGVTDERFRREVAKTRDRVNAFLQFNEQQVHVSPAHEQAEVSDAYPLRADLDELLTRVDSQPSAIHLNHDLVGATTAILDHLSAEMDTGISLAHDAAATRLTRTILLLSVLSVAGALATILLSIQQYRSLVGPMTRLRDAVQRIARGNFRGRVELSGDREFVQLGAEFNKMADELDSLYQSLETQVRQKSMELSRSERLASVGFLAAGVAHEINNPLNVISAYAELALRRLQKRLPHDATDQDNLKALDVVRDEALRCKAISQKLLSLVRNTPETKEPVSLRNCAEEVVALVSALPGSKDRRIRMEMNDTDSMVVMGNEVELKQVLLNIVVNALEAVEPRKGEVNIQGERRNGWVEISVADNGMGMDQETLDHVFEPFFTRRRADSGVGVGLGLSISHAIVSAHQGTITAASAGPACGSRFTIQLPYAELKTQHEPETLQVH